MGGHGRTHSVRDGGEDTWVREVTATGPASDASHLPFPGIRSSQKLFQFKFLNNKNNCMLFYYKAMAAFLRNIPLSKNSITKIVILMGEKASVF